MLQVEMVPKYRLIRGMARDENVRRRAHEQDLLSSASTRFLLWPIKGMSAWSRSLNGVVRCRLSDGPLLAQFGSKIQGKPLWIDNDGSYSENNRDTLHLKTRPWLIQHTHYILSSLSLGLSSLWSLYHGILKRGTREPATI
jgi:hypothetical protein